MSRLLWKTACLVLITALAAGGCAPATSTAGPQPAQETAEPTLTISPTGSETPYPGPEVAPTTPSSYPLPETPTQPEPYPGAETPAAPTASQTPTGAGTTSPAPYPGGETTIIPERTAQPARPTGAPGTTPGTGTPAGTPTEFPITTAQPPPEQVVQTVSIWHSWNEMERQVLDYTLRQFQTVYPNIRFMVTYYPEEQLHSRYAVDAYNGSGPSLVLGPAEWGPAFYDQDLVADVSSIAEPDFLATINPAALAQSRYRGALIGLPYSIREGVVLYRNREIIPRAAETFDDLIRLAREATGGGKVGAYLETSFNFSGGALTGIGGAFIDETGSPAFNSQAGLDWLALLDAYELAGLRGYNSDRDLILFKAGQAGLIIESTLRQAELVEAVGEQNLAIDPWPSYMGGTISGFIKSDAIYLNSRTTGDERYAALLVMGFFLAPEVQAILTAARLTPAVMGVQVEEPLMQQALTAFENASPYPVEPGFDRYAQVLERALQAYLEGSASAAAVLAQAEKELTSTASP